MSRLDVLLNKSYFTERYRILFDAFAANAWGGGREATHVVIGKLCSLFSRLASLAGAERLATRTTSRTTFCIELNAGYLSAGYQPV